MGVIKEQQKFSELEYCIEKYFNDNLYPIMRSVRQSLTEKQVEELDNYRTSASGIMHELGKSVHNLQDDSLWYLKTTGEWNSKTTDDYLSMCRESILSSGKIPQDLLMLAGEWKETMIKEIGQQRYDEISQKLGQDLSIAYINCRLDQLMLDRLVKDKVPKSSIDYIIQKAATSSLCGVVGEMNHTPLETAINRQAEKEYNPSWQETATAKAISFGSDIVITGGYSSWSSFASYVGIELAATGLELCQEGEPENPTAQYTAIENIISQGIFQSEKNVFEGLRKEGKNIVPHDNDYITELNKGLNCSMKILSKEQVEKFDNYFMANSYKGQTEYSQSSTEDNYDRESVPLIIRPGAEEAYLEEQNEIKATTVAQKTLTQSQSSTTTETMSEDNTERPVTPEGSVNTGNSNSQGWGNLMGSLGMDGLGKIGHNLGYVIAMLPDVIFGLFTGKSTSLLQKNSLLPLVSIIAGLYVKNPLLKMMMIGLGGLNLFSKASKDILGQTQNTNIAAANQTPVYKQYADEPLDPRVSNVQMKGNILIADIDRIPVTIQLNEQVVKAYQEGALPLNTLINAVLKKNDQALQLAQENYNQSQKETITRSRGI